jgi:hypothetical protein
MSFFVKMTIAPRDAEGSEKVLPANPLEGQLAFWKLSGSGF